LSKHSISINPKMQNAFFEASSQPSTTCLGDDDKVCSKHRSEKKKKSSKSKYRGLQLSKSDNIIADSDTPRDMCKSKSRSQRSRDETPAGDVSLSLCMLDADSLFNQSAAAAGPGAVSSSLTSTSDLRSLKPKPVLSIGGSGTGSSSGSSGIGTATRTFGKAGTTTPAAAGGGGVARQQKSFSVDCFGAGIKVAPPSPILVVIAAAKEGRETNKATRRRSRSETVFYKRGLDEDNSACHEDSFGAVRPLSTSSLSCSTASMSMSGFGFGDTNSRHSLGSCTGPRKSPRFRHDTPSPTPYNSWGGEDSGGSSSVGGTVSDSVIKKVML
jgi:hypothetical protein